MWRRNRAFVILALVALLLAGLAAFSRADPMTVEEKAAAFDALLEADPSVAAADTLAILAGRDLVLSGGTVTVDVEPWLHYTISLEDRRVKDFLPKERWWAAPLGILAASLLAMLGETFLPLPPVAKEGAATGLGLAGGILVWLTLK